MEISSDAIRERAHDHIAPRAAGELRAMSNIGYSAEQALADLVDNSIDAKARNILIRIFHHEQAVRQVVTADDGVGMSSSALKRAMQFGADIPEGKKRLGKYGIGLKTASFGQCSILSVLSRQAGRACGRRWTRESIEKDWMCGVLLEEDVERHLDRDWGNVKTGGHGTLVVWDQLRPTGARNTKKPLESLLRRITLHLGIVFHRFLAAGSVRIEVDPVAADGQSGLPVPVRPLDPFKMPVSGAKRFPSSFSIDLGDGKRLSARAVIWPPKRNEPEYHLGRNAAARQGLYFYRNDRVIQIGGWNELRKTDSEPHLSLARIAVELPPSMDDLFRLNVQKSGVEVPDSFREALRSARIGNRSFQEYTNLARDVYDDAAVEDEDDFPLSPGRGVPPLVSSAAKAALAPGEKRFRKVAFVWARLGADRFFELDRDHLTVTLNSRYRADVTGNSRRSVNDAPAVKGLLFLLLGEALDSRRFSRNQQAMVDAANRILLASVGREVRQ